jgi:predicted enzyme related to lactoylglutathione lyase
MAVHYEFRSTQPDATAKFLREFFGWETDVWTTDDVNFLVFYDSKEHADIYGDIEKVDLIPEHPTAVTYFQVYSVQEDLERAIQMGAVIYRPYHEIGHEVKSVIIIAPGGCHVGLWSY